MIQMDCPCHIKKEKDYEELKDEEKEFVVEAVKSFSVLIRRMLTYRTNYVELRKSYKALGLESRREKSNHDQQMQEERQKYDQDKRNYEEVERTKFEQKMLIYENKIKEERLKNQEKLIEFEAEIEKLTDENVRAVSEIKSLKKSPTNESNTDKFNVNVFKSDTEDMFAAYEDDEEEYVDEIDVKLEDDYQIDSELEFDDHFEEVTCGQRLREEKPPTPIEESPIRAIFSLVQEHPIKDTPTKKSSKLKIPSIIQPVVDNSSRWLSKAEVKKPEQENSSPKLDTTNWLCSKDKKSPKTKNSSFLKSLPSTSAKEINKSLSKLKQSKLDFSSRNISPIVTVSKVKNLGEYVEESPNYSSSRILTSRKMKRKNTDSEELFNFASRQKKVEEQNIEKTPYQNDKTNKENIIDENETYCPDLSSAIRIKGEPQTQKHSSVELKTGQIKLEEIAIEQYHFSQSSDVILVPGSENEQILIDESSVDANEKFILEVQKEIMGQDDNIMNIGNRELSPTQESPKKKTMSPPKSKIGARLLSKSTFNKESPKKKSLTPPKSKIGTRLFRTPPRTKEDKKLVYEPCYCDDCEGYRRVLRAREFTEEEIAQRMQKTSKHRTNKRLHNTPEGFWNPLMSDTEDELK